MAGGYAFLVLFAFAFAFLPTDKDDVPIGAYILGCITVGFISFCLLGGGTMLLEMFDLPR